ncbi:hypothetical protein FA045_06110 [Pedobacter cryotolerans]|uniref:Flippase-like domain-containing protein n=1 Tax=Pedobacter cryotolerans TaxID=2571270 RepID=A0A4U1C816_9SPHI|nr:hypothetical protein FA045_06110 [Pedobacter cryotolerans]
MYTQKAKILLAKNKRIFSLIIKIAIVILAFWFIYEKLIGHKDLKSFLQLIDLMPHAEIWLMLSSVIGLMLMNWGIEALKWKRLIKQVEPISLWLAIESVFCGLTWAVFTPNRLGEYGGRVFFLSPKRRIIGVVAMAVGNIGQLVLTNVFGAIAICIFVYRFTAIDHSLFLAVLAIAIAFCLFFIIFYFNIKWLNGILLSMRFTRKYKKFYAILARYKKLELLKILGFCLARYLVFSTQYFIMFLWLIPSINFFDVVMLVSILFFVQSSLPSLDLLDIGIRSITAIFFFKYVTQENTAVVACIASIWLINIIIPAILGSYFVFKLNFFGSHNRN